VLAPIADLVAVLTGELGAEVALVVTSLWIRC